MTLPLPIILNLLNLTLLCHSCLSTYLQISSIQNYVLARGAWDRVLLLTCANFVSVCVYMEWSGNIRDHKLCKSVQQISFTSQYTVYYFNKYCCYCYLLNSFLYETMHCMHPFCRSPEIILIWKWLAMTRVPCHSIRHRTFYLVVLI